MKKRLLAAILAVTMLLAALPALAASYDDVPTGKASTAVSLVTGLGIMEGSEEELMFGAEETVTRAQFALYAVKMINSDINFTGPQAFADVTDNSEESRAVNFLASINVLQGNSVNFRPDDDITYAEACRILLNILGYSQTAQLGGGYPAGYLTAAVSSGLNDNISLGANDVVTKLDAARLIYNALFVDTIQAKSNNLGTYDYVITDENILEKWWDVYETEGVLEGYDDIYIGASSGPGNGLCVISGVTMEIGDTDIRDYIGQTLKVYYEQDGSIKRVVAFTNSSSTNVNTTVTADAGDIEIEDGSIKYYPQGTDSGKKKTLKLADDITVIYNGKYYSAYKSLEELFDIKEGYVTFLSNNTTSKYNIIFIYEYEDMLVDRIDKSNSRIYFSNTSDDFTSPQQCEVDTDGVETVNIYGAVDSFSEILAEDVVTMQRSKDNSIINLYVTRTTVSGKITGVSSDEDDRYVYVDGEEYELSAYCTDSIEAGDEQTYALNKDGKIVGMVSPAAGTTSTSSLEYGYLKQVVSDTENQSTMLEIFRTDGTTIDAYTKETKIRVNGEKVSSVGVGAKLTRYELISFRLDADGNLAEVNRPYNATSNPDYYSQTSFVKNWTKSSVRYIGGIMGRSLVTANTIIFKVPKFDREKDTDYQIITMDDLEDQVYSDITCYDVDKNGRIGCMVIKEDYTDSVSMGNTMFIVNKTTVTWDEEKGESVVVIDGFEAGEEAKLTFTSETTSITYEDGWINYSDNTSFDPGYNQENPGLYLKAGDALQYTLGADGYVSAYRLIYNNEQTIYTGGYLTYDDGNKYFEDWSQSGSVTKTDFYDNLYIAFGDVELRNADYMAVLALTPAERQAYSGSPVDMVDYYRPINLLNAYVYKYDVNKEEVELGDMESISQYDTVFVRSKKMGEINEIIVFVEE